MLTSVAQNLMSQPGGGWFGDLRRSLRGAGNILSPILKTGGAIASAMPDPRLKVGGAIANTMADLTKRGGSFTVKG